PPLYPVQADRGRNTLARGEPAMGVAAGGPHPQHSRERPPVVSSPLRMYSLWFCPCFSVTERARIRRKRVQGGGRSSAVHRHVGRFFPDTRLQGVHSV